MANTNKPSVNTHQTVIIPPTGGPIFGSNAQLFRYYNNYPVVIRQLGQDPVYYVKRRPPAMVYAQVVVDGTAIRAVLADPDDESFWFCTNRSVVYKSALGAPYEDTNRLHTTVYTSTMTHFRAGIDNWIVVLEHGNTGGSVSTRMHFYDATTKAYSSTTVLNTVIEANSLVFLDGYLFMPSSKFDASQRIYNTTLGNPKEVLHGASFIDAEMAGDALVVLAKHHNHLVAFGRSSIEFFYNSANEVGSPLARNAAYAQNMGMYDAGSAAALGVAGNRSYVEIDDDIYFLGARNKNIQGLFRLRNFKVEKVSDQVLDSKLRQGRYIKLSPYDLEGETCVMMSEGGTGNVVRMFIPSAGIACEFQWSVDVINSLVVAGTHESPTTLLFYGHNTYPIMQSGRLSIEFLTQLHESFVSQYMVDYQDFNNNARKHWKHVDVLGSFGNNLVGLAYFKDNYSRDNTNLVNLPYMDGARVGDTNTFRFRNLGMSRRQGYIVYVSGEDPYLYKGVSIGYNQWAD
jgi:hypothetical protein